MENLKKIVLACALSGLMVCGGRAAAVQVAAESSAVVCDPWMESLDKLFLATSQRWLFIKHWPNSAQQGESMKFFVDSIADAIARGAPELEDVVCQLSPSVKSFLKAVFMGLRYSSLRSDAIQICADKMAADDLLNELVSPEMVKEIADNSVLAADARADIAAIVGRHFPDAQETVKSMLSLAHGLAFCDDCACDVSEEIWSEFRVLATLFVSQLPLTETDLRMIRQNLHCLGAIRLVGISKCIFIGESEAILPDGSHVANVVTPTKVIFLNSKAACCSDSHDAACEQPTYYAVYDIKSNTLFTDDIALKSDLYNVVNGIRGEIELAESNVVSITVGSDVEVKSFAAYADQIGSKDRHLVGRKDVISIVPGCGKFRIFWNSNNANNSVNS